MPKTGKDKKGKKAVDKKKKGKTKKTSGNYKNLIEKISKLSVLELADFVSELEEKFGPVQVAAAPAGAGGTGESSTSAQQEKSEFNVELIDAGSNKIAIIKLVKEITEKGLLDAKKIVEDLPSVLKEKVKKEQAQEMKKKIEQAGGKVELK